MFGWDHLLFVIGLVHGLSFPEALSDIGLPQGSELLALGMFNIGVELGQIAVILAVLARLWALVRAGSHWRARAVTGTAYAAGAIGTFWMIERLGGYFV